MESRDENGSEFNERRYEYAARIQTRGKKASEKKQKKNKQTNRRNRGGKK